MRIDAAERLGLGFDAVAAINPAIIHCAAIGFAQRCPYRARPAFDDLIPAASGLAGLEPAWDADPRLAPPLLPDLVPAVIAVYGVLAAPLRPTPGHTVAHPVATRGRAS